VVEQEEQEEVLVGRVHVELDQELDVIVIDHRTRSFAPWVLASGLALAPYRPQPGALCSQQLPGVAEARTHRRSGGDPPCITRPRKKERNRFQRVGTCMINDDVQRLACQGGHW